MWIYGTSVKINRTVTASCWSTGQRSKTQDLELQKTGSENQIHETTLKWH